MDIKDLELWDAHGFSSNHKFQIMDDPVCGCFYCLRIYDPKEIHEWIADEWGTAVCPYCGVGCSLVAEVSASDGKLVNVTSDHSDMASVNGGRSCVKGRFGWEFVNSEERLNTPLIKENGVFREASWDEALDVVAAGLSRNMGQTGFFASARCTNEDNYLMQRFAREVMRTNNVDHCAHL